MVSKSKKVLALLLAAVSVVTMLTGISAAAAQDDTYESVAYDDLPVIEMPDGAFEGSTDGSLHEDAGTSVCEAALEADLASGSALQLAPDFIEIESVTETSVTVAAPEAAPSGCGAEYSMDGESWQTSPTFEGLETGVEYTFYTRYAAGNGYLASDKCSGVIITLGGGTAEAEPAVDEAMSLAEAEADFAVTGTRYGYTTLTTDEKYVYNFFLSVVATNKSGSFYFDSSKYITTSELQQAAVMFMCDYPEYFWFQGRYMYYYSTSDNSRATGIIPMYYVGSVLITSESSPYSTNTAALTSAKTKFNTAVNNFLAEGISKSGIYNILLDIHDKLALHITYDIDTVSDQSAYGALVNGVGVCAGYARAYQVLVNTHSNTSISSWYVSGWGGGESHGWNCVFLNDGSKTYTLYTDVTWDDQETTIYHMYFNRNLADFDDDHSPKSTHTLPAAVNGSYDYFTKDIKSGYVNAGVGTAYTGNAKVSNSDFNKVLISYEGTNYVGYRLDILCDTSKSGGMAYDTWISSYLNTHLSALGVTGTYYYSTGYMGKEYQLTVRTSTYAYKQPTPSSSLFTVYAPQHIGEYTARITGLTTAMEWSTNKNFSNAKPCTSTTISNICAGTYYIRYKTSGNYFAGGYATVTVPEGPCPGKVFTDVSLSAWYHTAVDYVKEYGIMSGKSSTTFVPNANLTRAEIVQVLYNMEGKPYVYISNPYTDVKSSDWYYSAVLWAKQEGISDGTSATTFSPKQYATREQVVYMLRDYVALTGQNTSASASLSGYSDEGKISSWAKTAVQWAVAEGVMSGTTQTTISPRGNTTRAQFAQMIYNYFR